MIEEHAVKTTASVAAIAAMKNFLAILLSFLFVGRLLLQCTSIFARLHIKFSFLDKNIVDKPCFSEINRDRKHHGAADFFNRFQCFRIHRLDVVHRAGGCFD